MEAQFFDNGSQRVILGSPTKQVTSGRVMLPIRMPLVGDGFAGMPPWVVSAYEAVARYLTQAEPEVQQVGAITLAFYNDKPDGEMFAPPSAKVPGCELKAFVVLRMGDPEDDPEVELHFKAYLPFTRDFWAWIGEMAGKEVMMAFPKTVGDAAKTAGAEPELPLDSVPAPPSMESATGEKEPAKTPAKGRSGAKVN